MRIYSDVVKISKKINKEGKNGKPYFAVTVSYKFYSEKQNADFDINEMLFISPKLFEELKEGDEVIFEGIISRDKDSNRTDVNYYTFRTV